MPFGDFVNQIPPPVFLGIHLVLFLAGAYFAWRAFGSGASLLGWAFSLGDSSFFGLVCDALRER